MEFLHSVTG